MKTTSISMMLVLSALAMSGCNTYQVEYREVNTTRYVPSGGSGTSYSPSAKAEASSPVNSSSGSYGRYGTQEPVRKPPTFSP